MERLQGCLECTDWTVFIDACDDFDELTDTINSYINFCEEKVNTVKKINRFSNEKLWVTKELRELLKKKRQAHKNKDLEEMRKITKRIKTMLKKPKILQKKKREDEFT